MDLIAHRAKSGRSWRAYAKAYGFSVSWAHLHQVASGQREASGDLLREIEAKTGGAVTSSEVLAARKRFLDSQPVKAPQAPAAREISSVG